MHKSLRYLAITLGFAPVAILFQNCGQAGTIAANTVVTEDVLDDGGGVDDTASYRITKLDGSRFICEPFGGNTGSAEGGLRAELSMLDPMVSMTTQAKNSLSVLEYFKANDSRFIKSEAAVFLSQVNVPARKFDQGFLLSDGNYLSDSKGNKLIEYFGLKMTSVLKLGPNDQEGYYELATLSDDGTIVYADLKGDGNYEAIVSNDMQHATKMVCAAKGIYLDKNSRIPIVYYYNQGPRTEIANVLVWKYHGSQAPDLAKRSSQVCGVVSQLKFWDASTSTPKELWAQVLAENYKIIGTANFQLPGSQVNPCAAQATNMISNTEFSALVNMQSNVTLNFITAANVKAQLYLAQGANRTLVESYDFSAQMKDRVVLPLPVLIPGEEYSLEVVLELPSQNAKILNEVKFRVELL